MLLTDYVLDGPAVRDSILGTSRDSINLVSSLLFFSTLTTKATGVSFAWGRYCRGRSRVVKARFGAYTKYSAPNLQGRSINSEIRMWSV